MSEMTSLSAALAASEARGKALEAALESSEQNHCFEFKRGNALAQRVAAAQRAVVSAIEGIVPNPCPCSDEEFCGECGVVKIAESVYVALAPAAAPGTGGVD